MLTTKEELCKLFADYDEERLLLILTTEREMYRPEALAAAEKVLMRRDPFPFVPAPPPVRTAQTLPTGGRTRPKRPYGAFDFVVDVLLFSFLFLTTRAMDVGSVLPESWLADGAVRLLLVASLTMVVMYLRNGWRTKEW